MRQLWRWSALIILALGVLGGRFSSSGDGRKPQAGAGQCLQHAHGAEQAAPARPGDPARTWPESRRVPSPIDRLDLTDLNVAQSLAQLRQFEVVDRFKLPSSGVRVVLRSQGPVEADPAALDHIVHTRLKHHAAHPDPVARRRFRCFKHTIVDRRLFEGAVVNIYVPSDPRMCIRNLRLVVPPDDGDWGRYCHWKGATPPVRLSGLLGEVRLSQYHMVIAPGVSGWSSSSPDPVLADIVRHESDHLWDWMMGVSPAHVSANERRALRGDTLIDEIYDKRGKSLPNPFSYPAPPG